MAFVAIGTLKVKPSTAPVSADIEQPITLCRQAYTATRFIKASLCKIQGLFKDF